MGDGNSSDEKEVERPLVAKSAADLQRLKLQKLMKNPDKPVVIPERPKIKGTASVPEFVRNVMGSSAGAGSGEFHVYRHLRRKEYSRQKYIQEKGQKELLDEEYHKKLEENKRLADEVTAKKRAKRLKNKQKLKQKKFKPSNNKKSDSDKSDTDNDSSDEERANAGEKIEDLQDKTIHQENIKNGSNVITNEKDNENIKMEIDNENVETGKGDENIKTQIEKDKENTETEKGNEESDKSIKIKADNENIKIDKNEANVHTEEDTKSKSVTNEKDNRTIESERDNEEANTNIKTEIDNKNGKTEKDNEIVKTEKGNKSEQNCGNSEIVDNAREIENKS